MSVNIFIYFFNECVYNECKIFLEEKMVMLCFFGDNFIIEY